MAGRPAAWLHCERAAMKSAAIPAGDATFREVKVLIDVPIGGPPIEYGTDKPSGALMVDRFLHTPMHRLGDYGFIPDTLPEDGDPRDVLVANTRVIRPGAVIAVRPVGVPLVEEEHGPDETMIGVPAPRPTQGAKAVRI
jgi:inorganic pyrophosphatase